MNMRSLVSAGIVMGASIFSGCGDPQYFVPLEEKSVGGSTNVTSDGGFGGSGGTGRPVPEGGSGKGSGGSEPVPEPTPISFDDLSSSSQAAIDYANALVNESQEWQNEMEWNDPRVGLKFYSNPLDCGCKNQKALWGREAMEILYAGNIYVRCLDPGTKKQNYDCLITGVHAVPVFETTRVKFRPVNSGAGDKDILVRERSEGVLALEDISLVLNLKSTYNP